MGADGHGKQELDPQILIEGRVVVDDFPQARGSGEINVPLRQGLLEPADLDTTLGQVVAGAKPGRTAHDQITIFDSTGLAIQDVALARLIYEAARRAAVGRRVDFFA